MSDSRPPSPQQHEHFVQATVQPAIQQAIATAAPQFAQSGRARGTVNYSREELMSLLCLMERLVPVDTRVWEDLCEEHCVQYPGHTVDSLKRKYTSTYRKKGSYW